MEEGKEAVGECLEIIMCTGLWCHVKSDKVGMHVQVDVHV